MSGAEYNKVRCGPTKKFADIVGRENVSADDYDRVKYGHGKSVDENLALRRGMVGAIHDLVLHPRDKAEVAKIVAYCSSQRIPIVTYGAGSGVVFGGLAAQGGVAVVLRTHMNKLLAVNELNQTAVVQPGMMGPDYEAALNDAPRRFGTQRGYTCGQFPQSLDLSSVGGWILPSGSGQASTYYGDACELVVAAEYVTPAGTLKTLEVGWLRRPASFGEVGLLLNEPRSATVVADSTVLALSFDAAAFHAVFEKIPEFGLETSRHLARRLHAVTRLVPLPESDLDGGTARTASDALPEPSHEGPAQAEPALPRLSNVPMVPPEEE